MELSVVVPTLNNREGLAACLDALAAGADAEVVVVNGPSTDGTTGMVRDREDVDVLVELPDRNLNAARNAGIRRASGDVVALLGHDLVVEPEWADALFRGMREHEVVTGPTRRQLRASVTAESVESRTIAGRHVTYFNGGNAAFTPAALDALDGFDEYLPVGGARDAAHRLAGLDYEVEWLSEMGVRREVAADGGLSDVAYRTSATGGVGTAYWHWRHRSLSYRLAKNYGLRPTVVRRVLSHAGADGLAALKDVARGDTTPSSWVANGRDVLAGIAVGTKDGLVARVRDRSPARNPNGRSGRPDRAVAVYDRRQ